MLFNVRDLASTRNPGDTLVVEFGGMEKGQRSEVQAGKNSIIKNSIILFECHTEGDIIKRLELAEI